MPFCGTSDKKWPKKDLLSPSVLDILSDFLGCQAPKSPLILRAYIGAILSFKRLRCNQNKTKFDVAYEETYFIIQKIAVQSKRNLKTVSKSGKNFIIQKIAVQSKPMKDFFTEILSFKRLRCNQNYLYKLLFKRAILSFKRLRCNQNGQLVQVLFLFRRFYHSKDCGAIKMHCASIPYLFYHSKDCGAIKTHPLCGNLFFSVYFIIQKIAVQSELLKGFCLYLINFIIQKIAVQSKLITEV